MYYYSCSPRADHVITAPLDFFLSRPLGTDVSARMWLPQLEPFCLELLELLWLSVDLCYPGPQVIRKAFSSVLPLTNI